MPSVRFSELQTEPAIDVGAPFPGMAGTVWSVHVRNKIRLIITGMDGTESTITINRENIVEVIGERNLAKAAEADSD